MLYTSLSLFSYSFFWHEGYGLVDEALGIAGFVPIRRNKLRCWQKIWINQL